MYTYINTRLISGGASAVLYKKHGGGYTVTVYQGNPTGVSYDFKYRSAAVAWRETLRKV